MSKVQNVMEQVGHTRQSVYKEYIISLLSEYTEVLVRQDGSIQKKDIKSSYFLNNDIWNVEFYKNIPMFRDSIRDLNDQGYICFPSDNVDITNEMKLVYYDKLFSCEWQLLTAINNNTKLILLSGFLEKVYPDINSFLDLNIDDANRKWIFWLSNKGINTKSKCSNNDFLLNGKIIYNNSCTANFLINMYKKILSITDIRIEWEKDVWDIRKLEKYGLLFNKTHSNYYIYFDKINNTYFRNTVKRYIREKIISNNRFTCGTAQNYLPMLTKFMNFISDSEPRWKTLKSLDRNHVEKYIEWLHTYCYNRKKHNNDNSNDYMIVSIRRTSHFLTEIQLKEYDIAPKISISKLFFDTDKPTKMKKAIDQIKYIPDSVLEQLFNYINYLDENTIPAIWVMFKTGLRISDVLSLHQNCLIKLNGKYWVETNVRKTYEEGHRVPIDDDLADILATLITKSIDNSNNDNNPDKYIFVRYSGRRKGLPITQTNIKQKLNILAAKHMIKDEMGNIFHFNNHAFRHTYAIKMLNNGADIVTIQELLAHASIEMTLRYAHLLDDTKRKAFDNAVKQGIFSFVDNSELYENVKDDISTDIIEMLWLNHKLNAIDTPYGSCLQKANGKCSFAKQPPCLTCNGGLPCKDLCIGAIDGDIQKYEIMINSTTALIQNAKLHNRYDAVQDNKELLDIYQNIYSKIAQGNIIYSRIDRLKKKGTENE